MLDKARADGYLAQRFEDALGCGIPDTFIGSPFQGVWLECKWRIWPKKKDTPLLTLGDNGLRGTQYQWLVNAWMRPCLSGVIVGVPEGWVAVPTPMVLAKLIDGPASEIHYKVVSGTPTMEQIREELNVKRWL